MLYIFNFSLVFLFNSFNIVVVNYKKKKNTKKTVMCENSEVFIIDNLKNIKKKIKKNSD